MPGMDGAELFARLRQVQPELIGVFLTAYATLDTVYPAICAGIVRVLAKPANAEELLPLVAEYAGSRLLEPGTPVATSRSGNGPDAGGGA
jgi:DNA-binding NtrC family response regulator